MSDLQRFIFTTQEPFRNKNRIASLYSDFSVHENTNPHGYHANLDAWRHALVAAAREGLLPGDSKSGQENDRLVLATGEQLAGALETGEWGRPIALGRVVQDAVNRRDFIALADYENAATSIYHRNWIPSLGEVLSWGWKQLGFGGVAAGAIPTGRWVMRENLEAASASLLEHLSKISTTPTSSIHTLATLRASLPPHFSQADIALLLTYLSRDKPHLTYKTLSSAPRETIIKFSSPPSPITESDIGIANLKTLLLSLETQISPLESSVSDLDSKARSAVASGQTAAARAALRRKKLVSDALEKRRDNVYQLHEILTKINQAQDQVAMVRAMEASTSVLRHLNAEVGGVEAAENASDALQEQMQTVDEISGVVNEIGVSGAAVDEADVEDEFEALLGEEQKKKDAERAARDAAERERKAQDEAREAEKVRERLREVEELERKRAQAEAGRSYGLPSVPDSDVEAEVEKRRKEIAGLHIDAADETAREKQPAIAS